MIWLIGSKKHKAKEQTLHIEAENEVKKKFIA